VSSGYRQLEQELWVELRRGSGIFVRESKLEGSLSSALTLDQWIANLFRCARKAGALPACGPAQELRRIVAVERQKSSHCPGQDTQQSRGAFLLGGGGAIIGGFVGRDFPIFHGKVIYKR